MSTQTQRVLKRLVDNKLVTASYGRSKMNIDHVKRQVYMLRKAGHNIVSQPLKSNKIGRPRVKYILSK
jgi:response regulator of citrate/malate metabolism